MPIFSFWDPAVLPLETFSRPFGHNRSLHWANHIAPLTRVAPCSLSLLSTLAGQLWSCQGSRSANATQLALGRLRYGVWLMGALSRSAAEKLSSLSLSSFVDKWFWNWRPTEINITGIRKINGTTKIARTWIAPVQFLPTLYRLLDHPINLSQSVRAQRQGRLDVAGDGSLSCSEPGASFLIPNYPMSPGRMIIVGLLLNVFSHGKHHLSDFEVRF